MHSGYNRWKMITHLEIFILPSCYSKIRSTIYIFKVLCFLINFFPTAFQTDVKIFVLQGRSTDLITSAPKILTGLEKGGKKEKRNEEKMDKN